MLVITPVGGQVSHWSSRQWADTLVISQWSSRQLADRFVITVGKESAE